MVTLNDITRITHNQENQLIYKINEDPQIFIEINGEIYRPTSIDFKDGHIIIGRNSRKIGNKTEIKKLPRY